MGANTVQFYYDTIEKTDPPEDFYTAAVWSDWGGWRRFGGVGQYDGKLFRRKLSDYEARALAELPSYGGAVANLTMLFNGEYGSMAADAKPPYRISGQLPYEDQAKYRNIEEVGTPVTYSINQLDFALKPGKVVFQPVKARRFLKNVTRYCQMEKTKVIIGDESTERIARRVGALESLGDEQKLTYIRGNAYEGTPKQLMEAMWGGTFQVVKKYYVGADCCEVWEHRATRKQLEFENNALKRPL
jgi:hypothetical protein